MFTEKDVIIKIDKAKEVSADKTGVKLNASQTKFYNELLNILPVAKKYAVVINPHKENLKQTALIAFTEEENIEMREHFEQFKTKMFSYSDNTIAKAFGTFLFVCKGLDNPVFVGLDAYVQGCSKADKNKWDFIADKIAKESAKTMMQNKDEAIHDMMNLIAEINEDMKQSSSKKEMELRVYEKNVVIQTMTALMGAEVIK